MDVEIFLNNKFSKLPTKGSFESAGYDLYSIEETIIEPSCRKIINIGIKIIFANSSTYLRIAPRSGLSCKGIDIGAGVVDSDYRGEIKVLMINNSKENYKINIGDRIAQAIFEKCDNNVNLIVENNSMSIQETKRGEGGFGSSGK